MSKKENMGQGGNVKPVLRMKSVTWVQLLCVLFVILFGVQPVFAYTEWTWRNPTPGGNIPTSIVWTGTQFVSVGENGGVLRSSDGITWVTGHAATVNNLNGVAWNGSALVAVGSNGVILTSPDGVTWTARISGTTSSLQGVTWSGDQFVAVGTAGAIGTSPDGITWTSRDSDTNKDLMAVSATGTHIVAVGKTGTVLTSVDGAVWTTRSSGVNTDLYTIASSGTLLVSAGSNGKVVTSENGIDWMVNTLSATIDLPGGSVGQGGSFRASVWSGSQWVLAGTSGTLYTSTDGSSWISRRTQITMDAGNIVGLASSATKTVGVGFGTWGNASILVSSDGAYWGLQSGSVTSAIGLESIAYGPLYVAVGSEGAILTSPDGIAWTARSSGTSLSLRTVVWTGSRYLAAGGGGVLLASIDGVAWSSVGNLGGVGMVRSVSVGDKAVFVGENGTIATLDAANVVAFPSSLTAEEFTAVAIGGGGRLVAVGYAGVVRVSDDGGVTWVNRDIGADHDLVAITWAGTQFVAGGFGSSAYTSPNGDSWTQRTSSEEEDVTIISMAWTGAKVVAMTSPRISFEDEETLLPGRVMTSADGINWTDHNTPNASTYLPGLVWGRRQLVMVGEATGAILTSPVAVPHISYGTPQSYTAGVSIVALAPINTGSAATSWSISPDITASTGLDFNSSSGVISGTASAASAATKYVVTALNAEGADTASITITIAVPEPPSTFIYSAPTARYSVGVPITMNRATVSGGQSGLSFALLSGVIPPGLTLNPVNGNIYGGVPTDTGIFTPVIRVSNLGGYVDAELTLIVRNPEPVISYVGNDFDFALGNEIEPIVPGNSGGAVVSWSIAPDLNANTGLTFNTTSGRILGTPTRVSGSTAYTITANGHAGTSHQAGLTIATSTGAPTVTYPNGSTSTNPGYFVFEMGEQVEPIRKMASSGIITHYSISPALPDGLVFNTTTGAVTGRLAWVSGGVGSMHTITAHGPGGTGSSLIVIIRSTLRPQLSYGNDSSRVFEVGSPITPFRPQQNEMTIRKWFISVGSNGKTLTENTGLFFNTTTGAILGTPNRVSPEVEYIVTAEGASYEARGEASLSVAVGAPLMTLAYASGVNFHTIGDSVSIAKTSVTGVVRGYSIEPALPPGLVFNTTTGRILGKALQSVLTTHYTITAHGPGDAFATATLALQIVAPLTTLSFNEEHVLPIGVEQNFRAEIQGSGVRLRWEISTGSNEKSLAENTGLVFNSTTGRIMGTPRFQSLPVRYTITLHLLGGMTAQTDLVLSVVQEGLGKLAADESESYTFRVNGSPAGYDLRLPALDPAAGSVLVRITDLSGRSVWSRMVTPQAGINKLTWDGRSTHGRIVPAGMYTVHIMAFHKGKALGLSNKAVLMSR
jgi:hypothetical protein